MFNNDFCVQKTYFYSQKIIQKTPFFFFNFFNLYIITIITIITIIILIKGLFNSDLCAKKPIFPICIHINYNNYNYY